MPDPKPRPNHQRRLQILRQMTPEQKLAEVFKQNERILALMKAGLRHRYSHLDEAAIHNCLLKNAIVAIFNLSQLRVELRAKAQNIDLRRNFGIKSMRSGSPLRNARTSSYP